VHSENFIVVRLFTKYRRQRHLLKHVVHLLEYRSGVANVFSKSSCTFLTKTEVLIYISVLVISSQKKNLLGIFKLNCHKEANNFETLAATVYVISQEQVIIPTDVSTVTRTLPNIKESHKINVGSVQITEDFNWRFHSDEDWLSLEDVVALRDQLQNLFSLQLESTQGRHLLLALLRLQQLRNKQTVQAVVRILLHERGLHIGPQLLRLLLKFVDRDFANQQTEVLSRRIHLSSVSVVNRHGNVGLVSQLEFPLVAHAVDILVALIRVFVDDRGLLSFHRLRSDLGAKHRVGLEQLLTVNARNCVYRDVGRVVLEPTVDIDRALDLPASRSEALNGLELVPFT